jgi:hypothetical protein
VKFIARDVRRQSRAFGNPSPTGRRWREAPDEGSTFGRTLCCNGAHFPHPPAGTFSRWEKDFRTRATVGAHPVQ